MHNMTGAMITDPTLRRFHDSIQKWAHPEHHFLDAQYSPGSNAPAVDLTGFVTDCLMNNNIAPIKELWSFITPTNVASDRMLYTSMAVDFPDWLQISETSKAELRAINILVARCAFCTNQDISRLACQLAASVIACRQLIVPPEQMDLLYRLTKPEMTADSFLGSQHGVKKGTEIALATAMSPLGDAAPCADKIKSIPPIPRLVVHDFLTRTWGHGLRYDLYYGERMYGCGKEHNQIFVEWLGFFTTPSSNEKVPSSVTKEKISIFLQDRGITFKKSATRKALLELIQPDPLMTRDLFLAHAPESRVIAPEWETSVKAWSDRMKMIEAVGGGVLKLLAQQSLYVK